MAQATVNLPPVFQSLFEAKAKKGLTFEEIGKAVGRDEVWVAAAFYGQAKLDPDTLSKLAAALDLPLQSLASHNVGTQPGLTEDWFPNRGQLGPMPPTDPVIYRLYEGLLVYGYPIKAVIHEKFGDGIMSLINCKVNVEKKEDPAGDRVLVTFDGKWLPYITW